MLFMKNAVIHGNGTRAGVQVGKGAKAILEHLIILRSKPGIQVEEGAVCHLTASVVADCECTLDSASGEFFRDFNFYDSRPIRWMGKQHLPENWDEFRKAAGHDGSSAIGKVAPKVGEDGNVSFDPWPVLGKGKKKPGPTQPIAVWRGEKP
jgi:hypothetical protein